MSTTFIKKTLALLGIVICAGLQLLTQAAHASQEGAGPTTWKMATVEPQDSATAQAIGRFARDVSSLSGEHLVLAPQYQSTLEDGDLLAAVLNDEIQIAAISSASLRSLAPIFELSALPFEARTPTQAQRLACLARPRYETVLADAGLHLLFIAPAPPLGLWSRTPISSYTSLANMRVSVPDTASARMLDELDTQSITRATGVVPLPLEDSALDAAISSSEPQDQRALPTQLKYFVALNYAFPLSFVVVSEHQLNSLPSWTRRNFLHAAQQTEQALWRSLRAQADQTYRALRQSGVTVTYELDKTLQTSLDLAAQQRVSTWLHNAKMDDSSALLALRESGPASIAQCGPSR
ncbi:MULTISPECIES: TRAP transporter substrate-binding protein DctP [unclassified Caballeronia]|uniref:TRAP transporter substrate-binding protein DctP n=1 Tax=unclassified Caballeronia TaxID=2646786 RepID=UPI002027B787|nr:MULTISPECIES: TRAP transporter substrate-binding protein DctP [unclassified Caballeronia]